MLRTIIVTIYTMVANATTIAKISLICESVIVAVVPATPIEPFVIKSLKVFSSITLPLLVVVVSNYSSANSTSSQPPSGIGNTPSCNPYSPPDVAYPSWANPIVVCVSITSSLGYLYLYLAITFNG